MSESTIAGPASESMILAAEEKLLLNFPPEYRRFLKMYGAVMGTGFEIAGIFADEDPGPPLWRDIVRETKRFRKSIQGSWSDSLLPISDDGVNIKFFIDTKNHENHCEVIAYGPGIELNTIATSLESFALKIARNELWEEPGS